MTQLTVWCVDSWEKPKSEICCFGISNHLAIQYPKFTVGISNDWVECVLNGMTADNRQFGNTHLPGNWVAPNFGTYVPSQA